MDKLISLIQQIHDTPGHFVLAITGGGSAAVSRLLTVAGASRTVLEATVPYHDGALSNYLGGTPDQSCSAATARALAMSAYQRARQQVGVQVGEDLPIFGLGCTAALATDRDRRGEDRCFIAVQGHDETRQYELGFDKTSADRARQEAVCSDLILYIMAAAIGLRDVKPELPPGHTLRETFRVGDPDWQTLLAGHTRLARNNPDSGAPENISLVFPGAFNPMHKGHEKMIQVAEELTGDSVLLEISTFNVDKSPLDFIEMDQRAQSIHHRYPLVFTNAPTFVSKSELFPGATFVVGADTLKRIGEPKYYNNDKDLRDIALRKIAEQGNRFLVFGRLIDGRFHGLSDLQVTPQLRQLSTAVPESGFREDLSSSQLRGKPAGN